MQKNAYSTDFYHYILDKNISVPQKGAYISISDGKYQQSIIKYVLLDNCSLSMQITDTSK